LEAHDIHRLGSTNLLTWSAIIKLFIILGAAVTMAACATSFSSGGARYDADKPQTFIPHAELAQAKGVAMGSAVTKGWTIAQSTDDSFVAQRTLNAAAAESVSPGASLDPLPAQVEVRSTFFQRDGGVDVLLDAQVITGRGSDNEKRQDFTESYRSELTRSLNSLQQAWRDSGRRVASAIPPLPTKEVVAEQAIEGETTAVGGESADQVSAETETQVPAVAAAPTPVTASVPVEERSTSPTPEPARPAPPAEPAPAASPDQSSNMLVLRQPSNTGIWAYYAEHYARIRGCTLTDGGAVLVEKQNYSETHRIDCTNGRSFEVRCNAGVCRGLR
jgi:hypothetical protein